jgi:hypothetical protein
LLITVGPVRGKRQIVMVDYHDLKRCERDEIMERPAGRASARIWLGALA